ncbi:GRAF protein, partial [Campylorhamphus procurvoides]|nr:GRAF protein [Campylorhamphus procurvoides]
YMAYLQGKNNQSCAGFLVAPNWVMTAAQCLDHKPLTVILGAHTVQRKEKSWQKFEVQDYHRHPQFTSRERGNDILLLKLNGNATSNSYVRSISFERSKIHGGTVCSVASYKTPTGTLREATVTIIKQRDCLVRYPGLANYLICGSSSSAEVPGKGLREEEEEVEGLGDVGAPLVCNNKAYGIFSYRLNNWPSFYTHITHYLDWVNKVMK